ncbi:MAG: carboxypeptidase regulatory-like domain-containing protein, partial [Actinomycetia bacterium]|nr:carboxypeptidase regulatory-like domain-containing protein [Actinomycetes bacterium]
MPSSRILRWGLISAALVASVPLWAEAREPRSGYLVAASVSRQTARVDSITRIENYLPGKHAGAPGDWQLTLEDGAGRPLWRSAVESPWHFAPLLSDAQEVPMSLRFPHLAGMRRALLADAGDRVVLTLDLGEEFDRRAEVGRERILEKLQANREAVSHLAPAAKSSRPTTSSLGQPRSRYEALPRELRENLSATLAEDHELVARWGQQAAAWRRTHRLPSSELRHRSLTEASRKAGQRRPADVARDAAFTLSGTVLDAVDAGPVSGAVLEFDQYDQSLAYVGPLGSQTTGAAGSYSVAADLGYVEVNLREVVGETYVSSWTWIEIAGDTSSDIRAYPAVTLSGTVTAGGEPVVQTWVSFQTTDYYSWSDSAYVGLSGTYSLLVPRDVPLNVSMTAPPPIVDLDLTDVVVSSDTTLDLELEIGWLLSGRITDSSGAGIESLGIVVRHVKPTTSRGWVDHAFTDSEGNYLAAIPRHLSPSSFIVSAYRSPYVRQARGISVSGDTDVDMVLEEGFTVSGFVRDGGGQSAYPATVWAYRGTTLITSARPRTDNGFYEMGLSPGLYTFRVEPWGIYPWEVSSRLAPLEMTDVAIEGPTSLDFTLPQAAGRLDLDLRFPSEEAMDLIGSAVRFELLQGGRVVAAARQSDELVWDGSDYRLRRSLHVEPGTYDVRVRANGCDPFTIAGVDATPAGSAVTGDLPEPYVWRGVLRDAAGDPLPDLWVISYDDLARNGWWSMSGEDGSFTIPMTPGGFIKFFAPEDGDAILHTERFGSVTESREADLVLERFPPFSDSGAVLTQIYGVEDRTLRYNIVVLGDGYTGTVETFTDVNGNGVWDGVLFHDLNDNGIYDGYPERSASYGEAPWPDPGTDPTAGNEPFTDLNGDLTPNLEDQTIFDEKSLDTVRSLFGQDFWNRNRDAFNIFRLRTISNQAGHDILDQEGEPLLERDTLLGSRAGNPSRGYILSADYGLVRALVNEVVPEMDAVVLLVNQPIPMGRPTSFIIMQGGPLSQLGNNYLVAHEMGHKVGLLADEYTEYAETYDGPE